MNLTVRRKKRAKAIAAIKDKTNTYEVKSDLYDGDWAKDDDRLLDARLIAVKW